MSGAKRQAATTGKSDEFRQAYTAESDFVAKVDEHNAGRICNQPLAKGR